MKYKILFFVIMKMIVGNADQRDWLTNEEKSLDGERKAGQRELRIGKRTPDLPD